MRKLIKYKTDIGKSLERPRTKPPKHREGQFSARCVTPSESMKLPRRYFLEFGYRRNRYPHRYRTNRTDILSKRRSHGANQGLAPLFLT